MKFYSIILLGAAIALATPNLDQKIKEYRDRQDLATPASVLKLLQDGNKRFATGQSFHGGYSPDARERIQVAATGQRPVATILSCIDSRTSPELVFDTAVGDLFTARVGGTVVNDDIIGSLEIAADSGSKVIIVLGHTECGAVKGACNNLEFEHFSGVVAKVKPAIAETNLMLDKNPLLSQVIGERVVTNKKYVAEVSHMNARRSTQEILSKSPFLREKVAKHEISIITAFYDIDSGRVLFDVNSN